MNKEKNRIIDIYELATQVSGMSHKEADAFILGRLTEFGFDAGSSQALAATLARRLRKPLPEKVEHHIDPLRLSDGDLRELGARLEQEGNRQIREFIIVLAAFAKAHPHPNGWIKYERNVLFEACGMDKLKSSEAAEITTKAHDSYGMEMRVIGSNDPIPCYMLTWQKPEGDLIDFGYLDRQTVDMVDDYIKNHPQKLTPSERECYN